MDYSNLGFIFVVLTIGHICNSNTQIPETKLSSSSSNNLPLATTSGPSVISGGHLCPECLWASSLQRIEPPHQQMLVPFIKLFVVVFFNFNNLLGYISLFFCLSWEWFCTKTDVNSWNVSGSFNSFFVFHAQ